MSSGIRIGYVWVCLWVGMGNDFRIFEWSLNHKYSISKSCLKKNIPLFYWHHPHGGRIAFDTLCDVLTLDATVEEETSRSHGESAAALKKFRVELFKKKPKWNRGAV